MLTSIAMSEDRNAEALDGGTDVFALADSDTKQQ